GRGGDHRHAVRKRQQGVLRDGRLPVRHDQRVRRAEQRRDLVRGHVTGAQRDAVGQPQLRDQIIHFRSIGPEPPGHGEGDGLGGGGAWAGAGSGTRRPLWGRTRRKKSRGAGGEGWAGAGGLAWGGAGNPGRSVPWVGGRVAGRWGGIRAVRTVAAGARSRAW